MTEVRLRPRAEADLIERTRYYRSAGGDDLGRQFFDSAIASLRSVEKMPGIGSPLIGEICRVPGLRSQGVSQFPVHWYYFTTGDSLDVVRLLADAQDLAGILAQTPPE